MTPFSEKMIARLTEKYPLTGPYYTSYPSVGAWGKPYPSKKLENNLDELFATDKNVPISLYLHYPFCTELCAYCCCYVIISSNRERMSNFLSLLFQEIDNLKEYFDRKSITPNIREIHLGGGSPNIMEVEEFDLLVDKLSTLTDIRNLDEFAIEIDVRTVDRDKINHYHERGINRISFGVQDFNPNVQEAINRVQPTELIEELLTVDLRRKFTSINFDIMWGLPRQTRKTFAETIETLKRLSPDRITLLHYGHFPEVYPHQGNMSLDEIASPIEKTLMNIEATYNLSQNGYERIGLDHFAKRQDELTEWKVKGELSRGFIGYPGKTENLIGLGPSGLSSFTRFYAQNVYGLAEYGKAVTEKIFPTFRGFELSQDMIIRRDVINQIIDYYELNFVSIGEKYNINFKEYFSEELGSFNELIDDGLMELTGKGIKATEVGRFFLRHIAMVFDILLREGTGHNPTSRRDSQLTPSAKKG